MPELAHLDFDLLFSPHQDGYQAVVVSSPAGDGQIVYFKRPVTDLQLENFALRMGRFRVRTRRVESDPVVAAKELGGRLYNSIFVGSVGECLRRSLDRARLADVALRIRLRLSDCPGLVDLPWELLYDRTDDYFLALSDRSPVVRYVQLGYQARTVRVDLPLHILVVRSEPNDFEPLDLAAEWSQVTAALGELTEAGLLTFTELVSPTLSKLRRTLLRERFHVLHYMGHGSFDSQRGGTLILVNNAGRSSAVTAEDLGVMLRDHTSMRLAILNACEAGRADPSDPFAGVADTLVRRGIPAVVAMQYEVSDDAAIEFAPALYGALAAGLPIDAAVAEARKAIYTVSQVEWVTPVLFLRGDDAHLFDISDPAPLSSYSAPHDVQLDVHFIHPEEHGVVLTATVGSSSTPRYLIQQLIKAKFIGHPKTGSYHLIDASTGRRLHDTISIESSGVTNNASLAVTR